MTTGNGGPLSAFLADWCTRRRKVIAELARRVAHSCKVDDVHDLRTSCRRMRALVVLFPDDPALGRSDLGRRAKRVMRALRGLRESDVLVERLNELAGHNAGMEQARAWLQRRMKRARKKGEGKAKRTVRKRARELDSSLRRLGRRPGNDESSPQAATVLAARVAEQAEHTRGLIRHLGTRPAWRKVHEVRVAVKYWRYAVELARETGGQRAAGLSPLIALQDLGGRIQDLGDLIARMDKARQRMSGRAARLRQAGLARLIRTARAARQNTSRHFLRQARLLLTDHGPPERRRAPHADGDARRGAHPALAARAAHPPAPFGRVLARRRGSSKCPQESAPRTSFHPGRTHSEQLGPTPTAGC